MSSFSTLQGNVEKAWEGRTGGIGGTLYPREVAEVTPITAHVGPDYS